jgi:apolipoprotein D and lipocalin family protein
MRAALALWKTISRPTHPRRAPARSASMKRLLLAAFVSLLCASCASPPINRAGPAPLVVTPIGLDRYVGRWFEIARFPNNFEKGCAGVTADYAALADGKISVVNTCRKDTPEGQARQSKGTARIVDAATNAKLKVTFFWPFEGDYWVLDRAADYSWSLVGEPSGRYLWILARTPKISDEMKADLLGRLKARGYNTDALSWTAQ